MRSKKNKSAKFQWLYINEQGDLEIFDTRFFIFRKIPLKADKLTLESKENCIPVLLGQKSKKQPEIVFFGKGTPTELLTNTNLTNRHLFIRNKHNVMLTVLISKIIDIFRTYFKKHNYIETFPPLISTTAEACEDTSTLIMLKDYYGTDAFLTQTAQFYLESFITPLNKVYSITKSFRRETKRDGFHLVEYTHIEGEIAGFGFKEIIEEVENIIKFFFKSISKPEILSIINQIRESYGKPSLDEKQLFKWINNKFKRFTYDEIIEEAKTIGYQISSGEEIPKEVEILLSKKYGKPIFVTLWPGNIKAFYMREHAQNPGKVLCADLWLPNMGEIAAMSERIYNPDELIRKLGSDFQQKRLKVIKSNIRDYEWYIDLRKYSSVPHSGFGIGFERLLMWILGSQDISNVTPFPRLPNVNKLV